VTSGRTPSDEERWRELERVAIEMESVANQLAEHAASHGLTPMEAGFRGHGSSDSSDTGRREGPVARLVGAYLGLHQGYRVLTLLAAIPILYLSCRPLPSLCGAASPPWW